MTGQRLLHYEAVEKLGEGGMEAVRKARLVNGPKAASALSHPNIITIYDIRSDGGIDFIAMEYFEGLDPDRIIWPTLWRFVE